MSCEIMLILTVRLLAFQGYTILHITYLNFFQKLEFFEKNRKKLTNSRFLLMTIFSMLSANSFTSQGHLIAKKKFAAEETSLPVQRFFLFGKRWFFLLKLVADNMVHGENLIAAKMNPDLTVCHMLSKDSRNEGNVCRR